MQINNFNTLKKYCKDEQSFEEIKEFVTDLVEERNRKTRSTELLKSVIGDDYDAIFIAELNPEKPDPEIVYVNDTFCNMTGYSRKEVIGKTPRILQGPQTEPEVMDKLEKRLQKGRSFFGQTTNYRKDGSEFVNQWDVHPLTDEEGNITHGVYYQQDMSRQTHSGEFLVDQKMKFDELREELHQTVVYVDLRGNIVLANKWFRELVGYAKVELQQFKVWDLFAERYGSSLREWFENAEKDSNFDDQELQGIIQSKQGLPIQILGETELLDRKDQKVIRCLIKNISLRKRVMKTLEKRNDYSKIVGRATEYSYKTT